MTVTGRNIEITEAIKNHLSSKMNKALQGTNENASCHVSLQLEKHRHIAEVTVNVKRFTAHAKEETENLYITLDSVLDKIKKQLKKHKARGQDQKTKHNFTINNNINS